MIVQVLHELTNRTKNGQLVWTKEYYEAGVFVHNALHAKCGVDELWLITETHDKITLRHEEAVLITTHSTDAPDAIAVRELHSACLIQIYEQDERDKAVAAEHLASVLGIGVD